MESEKIDVEINHFKILKQVSKHIYSKHIIFIWICLSLIYPFVSILSQNFTFITFHQMNFSNFIFPGVTGLSFSVTLLNATRNLFDTDSLKKIYLYVDGDNPVKGYLYNRTIAPYIITSYIWLIISLLALFSSIFTINFPFFFNEILLTLFYSILIAGFISLWWLVSTHISDVSVEIERKINYEHCKGSQAIYKEKTFDNKLGQNRLDGDLSERSSDETTF